MARAALKRWDMGVACHDTAQEMSDVDQLGKSSRVERATAPALSMGTTVAMCHG